MDRDVAAAARRGPRPTSCSTRSTARPGEDGTVQGMLDLMGLNYTHSGLATSVIAIDKELTKQALRPARHPHARRARSSTAKACTTADPLPRPYVLKPVNEGSSVGVAIVTDGGNYGNPIARDADGPVAGVRPAARRAVHPRPRADRRGARRRGAGGHRASAQVGLLRFRRQIYRRHDRACLPGARSPTTIRDAAMTMALEAHQLLGCRGASRSDFRWDDEQGVDGPLSARGQHPARHDAAQPGARAGASIAA